MNDMTAAHDILYAPIEEPQSQPVASVPISATQKFVPTAGMTSFRIIGATPPAYILVEGGARYAQISNTGLDPAFIQIGVPATPMSGYKLDPGMQMLCFIPSYISVCTAAADKTTIINVVPGRIE